MPTPDDDAKRTRLGLWRVANAAGIEVTRIMFAIWLKVAGRIKG